MLFSQKKYTYGNKYDINKVYSATVAIELINCKNCI